MALSASALFTFCAATAFVTTFDVGIAGAAPVATADQCIDATYRWGGDVVLGGASETSVMSYDTGIDVPVSNGATQTVVGVSADGLDAAGFATALPVNVGGMRATPGAAIAGGRVIVSAVSDGSGESVGVFRVVGVTVVVRRCAVVASDASPVPISVTVTSASSALPSAPHAGVDTSVFTLPATGAAEWRQTLIGASMVAAGAALMGFGRRRPTTCRSATAGDRVPEWPPVELGPVRG